MAKLDEDPNKLAEIADVLLMIHPMGALLLSLHGPCNACCPAGTSYEAGYSANGLHYSMVFDFKLKFLANGFREGGGDFFCGKKGMLWVGELGVHKARD